MRPTFQGTQVQPSVSYFNMDVSGVKPRATLDLKLDDPTLWTPSISGNGTMEIVAGAEGGIRSNIKFTGPGDRWCSPVGKLDPPRDFSGYDGIAVEYRCHGDDDTSIVRLYVVEPGGSWYLSYGWKAKKAWTKAQVCFTDLGWGGFSQPDPDGKLDLDKIGALVIGINTPKDDVFLEVRNIELIKF